MARPRSEPTTESQPSTDSWATPADEARARRPQKAELWSGLRILFRMVSLAELFELDALPSDLLDLAMIEYGNPGGAFKLIADTIEAVPDSASEETRDQAREAATAIGRNLAQLNRELCALALVEPKLTQAEIRALDYPDVEMLSGFVTRRVGMDAAGRRVGVEPLSTFAPFPEVHGCAEGCPQCEEARRRLSTVQ